NLHNRRRLITIEYDIGISKIVDHQNIMSFCQGHHPLKKFQIYTLSGWVTGKPQDNHFRAWNYVIHRPLKLIKKIYTWNHGDRSYIRTSNNSAINVNGVTGIGNQYSITRIKGG